MGIVTGTSLGVNEVSRMENSFLFTIVVHCLFDTFVVQR